MKKKLATKAPPFKAVPIPEFIMPEAGKKEALSDPLAFTLIGQLHQLRARMLAAYSLKQFVKNPHEKEQTATLLLPPHPEELAYTAKYAVDIAQRERIAVLAIVKAHINRLKVVEDMLAGFATVLHKTDLTEECKELTQALGEFAALYEAIKQSVSQRGPVEPSTKGTSGNRSAATPGGEGGYELSISLAE